MESSTSEHLIATTSEGLLPPVSEHGMTPPSVAFAKHPLPLAPRAASKSIEAPTSAARSLLLALPTTSASASAPLESAAAASSASSASTAAAAIATSSASTSLHHHHHTLMQVANEGGEAVHTLHVQVPAAVADQTINMSLRVNISTSAMPSVVNFSSSASASSSNLGGSLSAASSPPMAEPIAMLSTGTSTGSAVLMASAAPIASAAGSPIMLSSLSSSSHHTSGRKRKSAHGSKKSSSSKDKDGSIEQQSSISAQQMAPSSNSIGSVGGGSRGKSPFEKLNTLKMLLDCGHLTPEEYQERKTQIINDMTGTSTERKKPSPRRTLQPVMKTVVPHHPPDFSRILKERAEKLSFDVDTLEWHATSTRVKLDLVPFATGQLRNAYFLQECNDGEARLLVAKFCIRHAEPSSYLSDVEMQAVCAHYAALYNEHEPPLKVYYARSWLLKLRDRGDLVCCVEEYLPGAYVKYSNNNGYVGKETSTTEERERNTPHAFSHFTFVASDYRLMVVDIQGVNDSYTDPQIHTADGRGFGAGNLGTYGMEKFLESHRCNEVCRWLGLKSINKQFKAGGTAAPQYQMPFGGKIKKSTSRITEERNTFSRSVTVSEAFGGSDLLKKALLEDEPYSSSLSTCATGSSSLQYRSQVETTSKGDLKAPRTLHLSGLMDESEGLRWLWDVLRRLMCCCSLD